MNHFFGLIFLFASDQVSSFSLFFSFFIILFELLSFSRSFILSEVFGYASFLIGKLIMPEVLNFALVHIAKQFMAVSDDFVGVNVLLDLV